MLSAASDFHREFLSCVYSNFLGATIMHLGVALERSTRPMLQFARVYNAELAFNPSLVMCLGLWRRCLYEFG